MFFVKYAMGWGKTISFVNMLSHNGDNKSPVPFPNGNGSDWPSTRWNEEATKHHHRYERVWQHDLPILLGGYAKLKCCLDCLLQLWRFFFHFAGLLRSSLGKSDNETSLTFFYTGVTIEQQVERACSQQIGCCCHTPGEKLKCIFRGTIEPSVPIPPVRNCGKRQLIRFGTVLWT